MIPLAVAAESAAPGATEVLAALEARAPTENGFPTATLAFHDDVVRLIESNALATGEEFHRAGQLACPPVADYRAARMRHELLLAAVAKDRRAAESSLAASWDALLQTLGRPMRFDVFGLAARNPTNEQFAVEPAPAAIQRVWRDPAAARAAAAAASDNAEIAALVDADQRVRANVGKLTPDEIRQMSADDDRRNARMREIIDAGTLTTATDFASAALVMQHSTGFRGYQLAHELAVCALLIGDRGRGRWLVAATYDRMLVSVGHDQRFGTQGRAMLSAGAKPVLQAVDERGICDAERLALGCPTLAAKRANFNARAP